MPNVAQVLKEETIRLARKEARLATAQLRKDNAVLKRTAAELKRRLAAVEKANRRLMADAQAKRKEAVKPSDEELEKARITGKMIRSIRKRLKLSQADFAMLLGVTPVSISLWENKQGRITLRTASKAAVIAVRKLKRREAQQRLQGLKQAATARSGKKRKK